MVNLPKDKINESAQRQPLVLYSYKNNYFILVRMSHFWEEVTWLWALGLPVQLIRLTVCDHRLNCLWHYNKPLPSVLRRVTPQLNGVRIIWETSVRTIIIPGLTPYLFSRP